jgi:hypothetical protein
MRYTVVWLESAQNHLANLWVAAPDKSAVASASDAVDARLGQSPYANSTPRPVGDWIMYVAPLGVAYTVSEADRMVTVLGVWRASAHGESGNGQDHS